MPGLRLGAGAGRIENHGVKFFQFIGHQGFAHEIAHFGFQRLEAGGEARGLSQAGDGGLVAIDGGDLGPFRNAQGEGADAAEEIGHGFRLCQ